MREVMTWIAAGALASGAAAQTGRLYTTQFFGNQASVVQGGAVLWNWNTVNVGETGIAINGDIRIVGEFIGNFGSQYDLNTNVLSPNAYNNNSPGVDSLYDGTTDGKYHYSIGHNDFPSNFGLFRYDQNWQNGQLLFVPQRRSSGITYDPQNNSLWVTNTVGNADRVQQYDMAGNLMSEFNVNIPGGYAIAYDYLDNTLWIPESFGQQGRLWQYDKNGNLLQQIVVPGMQSNPFGAEFDFGTVPAPGAGAILGLAGLAAARRRR